MKLSQRKIDASTLQSRKKANATPQHLTTTKNQKRTARY